MSADPTSKQLLWQLVREGYIAPLPTASAASSSTRGGFGFFGMPDRAAIGPGSRSVGFPGETHGLTLLANPVGPSPVMVDTRSVVTRRA